MPLNEQSLEEVEGLPALHSTKTLKTSFITLTRQEQEEDRVSTQHTPTTTASLVLRKLWNYDETMMDFWPADGTLQLEQLGEERCITVLFMHPCVSKHTSKVFIFFNRITYSACVDNKCKCCWCVRSSHSHCVGAVSFGRKTPINNNP